MAAALISSATHWSSVAEFDDIYCDILWESAGIAL